MKTRHTVLAGLMISGLLAAAGISGAKPEEGKDAERLRAQRDQIEKLAGPLLDRVEILEKFKEPRFDHKLAVTRLETEVEQAGKMVEVMEIAVKEYEEGTYPTDLQVAEGSIKLAESDLAKAEDRMKWSEKMRKLKHISEAENQAAKLAFDKAKYTLEHAKRQLTVLTQFTKRKELTERMAAVEKARSKQLALQKQLDDLKAGREAAEKQAEQDSALSDGEVLVLFKLREAIAFQNQDRLDDAQKALDEATQLARAAEERRARLHFEKTETRLRDATWTLRDRGPKTTE